MTINQVLSLLAPMLIFAAFVIAIIKLLRAKKKKPVQTHQPHSPNSGNDSAAIARSVMEGRGANFTGMNF
ncbi:hypothetical protein HKX54_07005 [Sulfitobacter sp. M57]|uniref:hypothetical protein n=1 Tax=unclassified Sulfitobacter TaxID=196795 RepID=UPI0023E1097F|nr:MULTISPECIES: hypothetical protein [unclassified Sulfitobacter]MDF3414199.1 hypothetical protein [Sulfitobacter sp. KE5]MDF3420519.1 hypothetical protein [Sulfitobacter sp. KE43]MDF3432745.1 hypothetical protein [Sulfitobacter sp. KE42]MDF3458385.1 hypothetical protein [Sulfitobacter sp. S74]MDF3462285.1 hypothetical protein [Sulfitobacter sp. Ks18]